MSIVWLRREPPLSPAAAIGFNSVATELAQRLLGRGVGSLKGVAADGLLLVAGPANEIPWIDGLVWLGRDPRASELLVPTTLEPDVHPALIARAIGEPAALLPNHGLLVPLVELRELWIPSVRRWLKGSE